MSIIICGDLAPTSKNYKDFIDGTIFNIIDENLFDLLNNDNFVVANLETPLTDNFTPIKKYGPNLIAPSKTVKGIKKMGVNLLSLSNNHIMDQGEIGLASTIKALQNNDISYFGVGKKEEASKPFFVNYNSKKICFYCCAEHEFSNATENEVGANSFDFFDTFDHIVDLRKQCDYLILLYHGGKEEYRYPSPRLKRVCQRMIDSGVNLVICQHSHCIGCFEKYKHGNIVYGQGNFIFDYKNNEYWNTSILIKLDVNDNVDISYIPLSVKNGKVSVAKDKEKEEILGAFNLRSESILKDGFVEEEYNCYCKEKLSEYIFAISSPIYQSLFFRVINKLSNRLLQKIVTKHYLKYRRYSLINKLECEAHNELLLFALKKYK